jgi:hypothetical protein
MGSSQVGVVDEGRVDRDSQLAQRPHLLAVAVRAGRQVGVDDLHVDSHAGTPGAAQLSDGEIGVNQDGRRHGESRDLSGHGGA